jgi:hypothetical protein
MSTFNISDGRLDLLSVTTTSDRSGECQVYLDVRDGSDVHISRHPGQTHMRQGEQRPRGVHYRVPLSSVTNEVLARFKRRPEGGFELGLPDSPSSAVSWSFETVKPSKEQRPTYPIPGDLTELRVVGPSYVSDYENETRVPVASIPPAWVVLHPAD